METALWIAPLTVVLTATMVHAANSTNSQIEVTVDKLEVASITEETGDSLGTHQERVPSGGTLTYDYADPTDGHDYRLEFRLWAVQPERQDSQQVGVEYRWLDRNTGKTRTEESEITVEGAFAVSLYRFPERDREVILRLRPIVRRSEAAVH